MRSSRNFLDYFKIRIENYAVMIRSHSNLRQLRNFLGMTQAKMADLGDCSRHIVQSVEIGRLPLSVRALATKLSQRTGVDLAWLMNNDSAAPIINHAGERCQLTQTLSVGKQISAAQTPYITVGARCNSESLAISSIACLQPHGLKEKTPLTGLWSGLKASSAKSLASTFILKTPFMESAGEQTKRRSRRAG